MEDKYMIKVEVLDGGKLPFKAHKTDAGFDLFATEDVLVCNGEVTKHPLNIKLSLPEGTYAEITSKSGLGSRGMLVYAGIIDESYRGIPHVVCTKLMTPDNTFYKSISIEKGQKIAQMIIHPYSPEYFLEQVEEIDMDTARGDGGFGSSGAW